jgi:cold shock CspA family protein
MKGKVTHWKDDKGFGFIVSENGDEKLFFHISSVKTLARRPRIGDVVLYEAMRDGRGRLKAKAVVIEGVISKPGAYRRKTEINTEPLKKDALDYVSMLFLIGALLVGAYVYVQTGSIEKTIPFAVVSLVAIFVLNRQKKPKEKMFTCARCKKPADHNRRTIRAWNNSFAKLYCGSCHQRWLSENSGFSQHTPTTGGAGGCLVVSAALVLIPIVAGLGVYKWLA